MKTKRMLSIIILTAGFMLLSSSIGISGPPLQMKKTVRQPAAQSPTVNNVQIPKQVVAKVYSIEIKNISLTSQCRLKFKLTNTGADLSTDQHKNSYIKVGQNRSISLTAFDPDGLLKKTGQTVTSNEKVPLTKDTNVFIEVTLFNGIKTSKQKLLQPTCSKPTITIPAKRTEVPNIIPTRPPAPTVTPTAIPRVPQQVAQPTTQAPAITPRKVPQPTLQQTTTVPEAYKIKLPDLTVKLKLTIGQHNYTDKGMCNTINGNFTVTNIGDAPSGEYWFMVRSKDTTWGWHDFGSYPLPSLLPGESKTENCGIQLRRCPDDNITVGFNVTVDSKHEIKEKNENNNTDEKLFPSLEGLKEQPLKPTYPSPKITPRKVPQPTTQAPAIVTPQKVTLPQPVTKTKIPGPITPKSGDSPIGAKLIAVPTQHMTMPKTILQVERLGGDLQTWDSWAGTDTSMQRMDFRWKTDLESLILARWEVSLTPGFPYVIANGAVTPIPPKGTYGKFSIDLNGFSGTYTKPATFFIRVRPIKFGGVKTLVSINDTPSPAPSTANEPAHEPSTSVRITLVEAGSTPVTEFHLPEAHLNVVFQKILVVDDSDDLSGGDLNFQFTVNGEKKMTGFAGGKYDSGDMINLSNMTFIITDPPNITGIAVKGCDNDEFEGATGPAFVGTDDFPGHCGDDPDTASSGYEIRTYRKMGRWKIPHTPFSLYANGSKLKFEVRGYYEMYCDPCP